MTDTTRIDELEIRIAHQDNVIEDLNATVSEQWKVIDLLRRQVQRLTDRVGSGESHNTNAPGEDPPPPHY
jgi:SlyX protein